MEEEQKLTLMKCFAEIEDPRDGPALLHKFEDILIIAICGVICGANDWVNIELFGKAKEAWLRSFLELPNGIPSHDTFGRVFRQLDAAAFEKAFLQWIQMIQEVTEGEVVAVDGKKLRRSHDHLLGREAIYMIDAWASDNQITLGQIKVDEKSNEITAIPKLLELLALKGCIVTIDAIGCQHEIAKQIIDLKADYVLAVKQNQGNLYEEIKHLFGIVEREGFGCFEHDYVKTVGKHGRIEVRQCWTISDREYIEYLSHHKQWKHLRTIAMVETQRIRGKKVEQARRYYITSLENSASLILHAVRTHWQ